MNNNKNIEFKIKLKYKLLFQVKVLYVRNLTQEVTENRLKETFEVHGSVERVKKIKDYAFIHFNERSCALKVIFNIVLTYE